MRKLRQSSDGSRPFAISRRTLLQGAGVGVFMQATGATTALAQSSTPAPEASPAASGAGQAYGFSVFPRHGSRTASPGTEISFRGVSAEQLGPLRVAGATSGGHSGVMMPHGDGRGVSFVPDRPFAAGEDVTVSADLALGGETGDLMFQVSTPVLPSPPPTERIIDSPVSAPQEFRSRPDLLPPSVEILADAGDTAPGYIFVAPRMEDGQAGVMIMDNAGEVIWYETPGIDHEQSMDFKVQHYRGQPVLVWWHGAKPTGYGVGHYVIRNSAYETVANVQVGNGFQGGDIHEVLITPRDTLLVPIYAPVRWDMTAVDGAEHGVVVDGVIQEIEIETGRVLFEWHSLDHVSLEESDKAVPEDPENHWDYLHFNSIDEDSDGNLYISSRHCHSVHKISRDTGEVMWRLHGNQSDFAMGEGTEFFYPHDARWHPEGRFSIFDNGTDSPNSDYVSRGILLQLDEETMTADLVQDFPHPTGGTSPNQSNMQMLPNGNALVGWGPLPDVSEHAPDGEVLLHVSLSEGCQSYRSYRFPWVGTPTSLPDIVVEDGTAYVSWNGATGVAEWTVLTGSSPDDLQPSTTAARTGFETEIEVADAGAYVAVQALDATGRILATSGAVRAG